MYTLIIQIVLWVAMETVRFHIVQTCFFLGTILVSHLVGPSEQFDSQEKLSWWGCKVDLINRLPNKC